MSKDFSEYNFEGLSLEGDEPDGPASFDAQESDVYNGPERRMGERRKVRDRRTEMRFGSNKHDRRSGMDRRKGSWKTSSVS